MGSLRSLAKKEILPDRFEVIFVKFKRTQWAYCLDWGTVREYDYVRARERAKQQITHSIKTLFYKELSEIPKTFDMNIYCKWSPQEADGIGYWSHYGFIKDAKKLGTK